MSSLDTTSRRYLMELIGPLELANLSADLTPEQVALVEDFFATHPVEPQYDGLVTFALNPDGTVADEQGDTRLKEIFR